MKGLINRNLLNFIHTVIIENWNGQPGFHSIYYKQLLSDVNVENPAGDHKKIEELITELRK